MLRLLMPSPGNLLKIAALWTAVSVAHAQATDPDVPSTTATTPAAMASPAPLQLPPERRWRLGVALGYGERTNPLIQSEDIPVVVDLDIAWFGKRWFFDNGDLGFSLFDRPRSTTNLVARVNSDRAFFSKTNTKYVNFTVPRQAAPSRRSPDTARSGPDPSQSSRRIATTPSSSASRSLIDGEWGAATLRAFHDVSGTHDGYELSAHYSRPLDPRGGCRSRPPWACPTRARDAQRLLLGRARGRGQPRAARVPSRAAASAGKAACVTNYYLTQATCASRCPPTTSGCSTASPQSPLVEDDSRARLFRRSRLDVLTMPQTRLVARSHPASRSACPAAAADVPPVRLIVKPLLCVIDKRRAGLHR